MICCGSALRLYPGIRPEELRVSIVSNTDRILPAMHEKAGGRGFENTLAKKGVQHQAEHYSGECERRRSGPFERRAHPRAERLSSPPVSPRIQ